MRSNKNLMTYNEQKYQRRLEGMTDGVLEVEYRRHFKELLPEMALIMLTELRSRGLLDEELGTVENNEAYLPEEEIRAKLEEIKNAVCPRCGKSGDIVGVYIKSAVSVVVKALVEEEEVICCRECAKDALWRASLLTAAAGWWSLPGIFVTPWVLGTNLMYYKSGFPKSDDRLRLIAITTLREAKGK